MLENMLSEVAQISPILIAVVVSALLFDFVNGWNDAANAIATIIGTRVLSPAKAITMAAVTNLTGALAGTAVAATITKGIIHTDAHLLDPNAVVLIVLAAMIGAIIWAAWMTLIGMPISGSHSLIGGLVGAAVAAGGTKVLIGSGITKVLLAMLVSPVLGALLAFLCILALTWFFATWRPKAVSKISSVLQIVSSAIMGFTHGLNDAQKVMGVITMALIAAKIQFPGPNGEIHPELWVKLSCATMISLGTAIGGWGVIKTLGTNLSKLDPLSGFCSEAGCSITLFVAAALGVPVSTTHTITGSIMGVGARKGIRSVRWIVGQKIIMAWVFTLPTTAVLAGAMYWILSSYLL